MTEEELRARVRDAVERHLRGADGQWDGTSALPTPPSAVRHPSFVRYAIPAGGGQCLIEPAVRCTHCGYCQSHGY